MPSPNQTAPSGNDQAVDFVRENFAHAAAQYTRLLKTLADAGETALLPRTFCDGKLVSTAAEDWVSGFFPGSLWYLYEHTRDSKWLEAARDCTRRVERIQDFTHHHDVGFMLYCSYGNGFRITGDASYRDVLLRGAESLATRYSPAVGAIQSWGGRNDAFVVIIDNMMNLELLLWASREGGNPRFREIAIRHAHTTLANHFREDGSCYHVIEYDHDTGAPLVRRTEQGHSDSSSWARGQAWALYGYTMMYRETRNPVYLCHAKKVAGYLMSHPRLPADGVPYWDFDSPDIPNAPRDASSAAIMASAFIELGGFVDERFAGRCMETAVRQLRSLASPAYRAAPGENGGFILKHSTGHFSKNSEVDAPLNYADYYFLEALLRHRAQFSR